MKTEQGMKGRKRTDEVLTVRRIGEEGGREGGREGGGSQGWCSSRYIGTGARSRWRCTGQPGGREVGREKREEGLPGCLAPGTQLIERGAGRVGR